MWVMRRTVTLYCYTWEGFVCSSQRRNAVRGTVRTLDSSLKHQPLASPDSQGDSQNFFDPDLAKIVTAWPTLALSLKAAVLAIIQLK
jgi:hypothetical protein